MRLMTCLHWMVLTMMISIASTSMPLSQILDNQSIYPENIIYGKICLQQKLNHKFDANIPTFGLKGFIFPLIYCSMITFWNMKIQSIMKTQCSSFKTYSCYGGKYRRNLQTFRENLAQSLYWGIFIILENVLVLFLKMYSEELGERKVFIIYNIFFVLLADIVSGLLVPIKYIILSKKKYQILWINSVKDQVYTRSPKTSVKIPRREFTPERLKISLNSPKAKSMSKYIVSPKKVVSTISVIEIV